MSNIYSTEEWHIFSNATIIFRCIYLRKLLFNSHSEQYMGMDSYILINQQLILDHSALIQYPVTFKFD